MKKTSLILAVLSLGILAAQAEETRRLLYMATPDGAQNDGRLGEGILVFDINKEHSFVKRIDLPVFKEGIRGFTGSPATRCVYYATSAGTLGCFDLETEKVVWEKRFKAGCDRSCITMPFDLTNSPPVQPGHVGLRMGGHGWVCFSLDGRFAYSHAPDIFDVGTKRKVGSF